VERGRAMPAVELIEAVDRLAAWSHAVASAYEPYDVLLTPTLAVPPPPIGVMDPASPGPGLRTAFGAMVAFMTAFDATGQPAVSLPMHQSTDGLPIGVQIVGRFGDEGLLYRLAGQLERARPWSERRPPIWD
jgi:amidase